MLPSHHITSHKKEVRLMSGEGTVRVKKGAKSLKALPESLQTLPLTGNQTLPFFLCSLLLFNYMDLGLRGVSPFHRANLPHRSPSLNIVSSIAQPIPTVTSTPMISWRDAFDGVDDWVCLMRVETGSLWYLYVGMGTNIFMVLQLCFMRSPISKNVS